MRCNQPHLGAVFEELECNDYLVWNSLLSLWTTPPSCHSESVIRLPSPGCRDSFGDVLSGLLVWFGLVGLFWHRNGRELSIFSLLQACKFCLQSYLRTVSTSQGEGLKEAHVSGQTSLRILVPFKFPALVSQVLRASLVSCGTSHSVATIGVMGFRTYYPKHGTFVY